MQFFWDSQTDTPCAQDDGPYDMLADFMQSDIQGDTARISHLFDALEAKTLDETGNSYHISLTEEGLTLDPLFQEAAVCLIPLPIFIQALEA